MPRVSVVIPAYNPGEYLREALRSVHEQTFEDWEVFVVDDASTEDLGWIAQSFPRVQLLRQPHSGASVARNRGVIASSGEFVAFMDQDDVWGPHKLERQVHAMTVVPDAGVCYSDLEILLDQEPALHGADGSEVAMEVVLRADDVPQGPSALHRSMQHFARGFVVPSSVLLRRGCLPASGLLDPMLPFSGDFDLLIKLGGRYPVVRVCHVDVYYRKHDNNFSDEYDVGRREVEALIGRYVAFARASGDRRLAAAVPQLLRRPRALYAWQAMDRARRSWKQRDLVHTAYHLWRSFLFDPAVVWRAVWLRTGRRLPVGRRQSGST